MSAHLSPFKGTRYEYEQQHLYFLPSKLFAPLEDAQPTYVVGSRGSGKTTLLKALNWMERLKNPSLQAQLKGDPFEKRFIGIYVKCPEIQLSSFDAWLGQTDPDIASSIFSLELDLIWLKPLLEAVSSLIIHKVLKATAYEEQRLVTQLGKVPSISLLRKSLGLKNLETLLDLADLFADARYALELAARLRLPVKEVIPRFPLGQVGSFGKEIAKFLQPLCDGPDPNGRHWHYKICFDESECLSGFSLKVINTVVRLSEWPTFYVVSFVRLPDDITSTLIPHLSHQKADRHLVELDGDAISDTDFQELAEGVATVRIKHQSPDAPQSFSLTTILGRLDINRLLASILNDSVRPRAKELLRKADELKRLPFYSLPPDADEDDQDVPVEEGDALPIYQAYIVESLGISLPSPDQPQWIRRRQDSREIRKRMVAAYLSICNDINSDVRYAYVEMLLQMSDKCMRDFLFQIQELFVEVDKPVEHFVTQRIPLVVQNSALKRASRAKLDSIPERISKAPFEAARIIEGFARLTAMIQSRGEGARHLASSERGLFEISLSDSHSANKNEELEMLNEAAEAGFLRIMRSDPPKLQFRVHTSLAPAFGFSYRGAYYVSAVTFEDIRKFRKAPTDEAMKTIINGLAARFDGAADHSQQVFEGLA